jgi:hypothetical protein
MTWINMVTKKYLVGSIYIGYVDRLLLVVLVDTALSSPFPHPFILLYTIINHHHVHVDIDLQNQTAQLILGYREFLLYCSRNS